MKFSSSLSALLLASMVLTASADDLTRWNFNGATSSTVPGGSSAPAPSLGSGTARLVGGATSPATFSAGSGSSDPLTTGSDFAWQTSGYPTTSATDESAGVEFSVSTVGWEDIVISYDLRHSNTSSRYESFQYSIDGSTFTTIQYFVGDAGDTWFNNRTIDLSGIAGAENNPNFKFRIVAAFQATAAGSGAPSYIASNTGSTYASTGTWRFDYVNVTATAVPETSSALLALLGGFFVLRRRR